MVKKGCRKGKGVERVKKGCRKGKERAQKGYGKCVERVKKGYRKGMEMLWSLKGYGKDIECVVVNEKQQVLR